MSGFCCLCGIMPSGKYNIVATIAGDENDVEVDEDISNIVTINASDALRLIFNNKAILRKICVVDLLEEWHLNAFICCYKGNVSLFCNKI